VSESRLGASPQVPYTAVDGLRIRELDGEAVVFEPVSWDAHLLNPAAVAVLELLIEAPRNEHQVAMFLHEALSPEERSRADEHAHRLLADLQSLGLVTTTEGPEGAAG
jgi:PqqD family protein of HPr-rel-A system